MQLMNAFSIRDNKTKIFYDLEINRHNQKTKGKTTMHNQQKQILRHLLRRILLLSAEMPADNTNEFNNESQYSILFRTLLQDKIFFNVKEIRLN